MGSLGQWFTTGGSPFSDKAKSSSRQDASDREYSAYSNFARNGAAFRSTITLEAEPCSET
ncbi:hypothetical protein E2C01_021913 [Portunus trituberculatus]|uniref:Uncharacterized protein n=1 Tax=Portunus trituberculatus TaxID=210409 RepID=A0A5B7E688_PORTR|nr:hypothetical protein [Portunus trituberculatus]